MAPKRLLFSDQLNSNFVAFVLVINAVYSSAAGYSEALILINFRNSLQNTTALSDWDPSLQPCDAAGGRSWSGVICDNGKVWGLQLENMGLGGGIDTESLSKLHTLRIISFKGNHFQGAIPDFSKLGALKNVFLSDNGFSGKLPDMGFAGMGSLKKLYLAGNQFSGSIPVALASLPRLIELGLDRNQFDGGIPNFRPDKLRYFNVSQNQLDGEIPQSLRRFNPSSFSGNKYLCGAPLGPCPSQSPNQSVAGFIFIVIMMIAVVAALVGIVVMLRRRKKSPSKLKQAAPARPAAAAASTQIRQKATSTGDVEQGRPRPSQAKSPSRATQEMNKQNVKLTFLRDDSVKFELTDLLKASAEILGSGAFGSTYKAALTQGNAVVKRFKYMSNVSREEFLEHMRRLGQLNHENILPIVAFYYRKEEKLIVTNYVENFSLAVQLHGNRSRGRPSPDWPTRLRILKGVAAGLQYLYTTLPSLTAPHGHLKSSNVLLDESFRPVLTDYSLIPVVNQEHAPEHMISYKSPEYKESRRITRKTDIWSFGILILETLTGRFPSKLIKKGSGNDVDLPKWVESVVRSGGADSAEVLFDKEMELGKSVTCRGEMMKLLKLGLDCCNPEVDQRPDIKEVVERIEEIKENDN